MSQALEKTVDPDMELRLQLLEEYGHNVINIHPSRVEFDLMTDSWTELLSDEMTERMSDLQIKMDHDVKGHLASELFPFEYFLNVTQGRSAEAFFWKAAARKDKVVIQNLLFPTSRHHVVINRMTPEEYPVKHIFAVDSDDMFRGNLDCSALRDRLARDSKSVAYIYIEAENNASGGYPVSLANVREIRKIADDYEVQMVLDATRLIENAVLIQRFEPGCDQMSIREIVDVFCKQFHHMTCSLAKDFGITRGGLVATNDERLYTRARDSAATFGVGINASDRAMINAVFSDLDFMEAMVNRRVDQASRMHAACTDAGLRLARPASGHCLLFDSADYLDTENYQNPVISFTQWVYQHSGVRGGLHVTGMNREYASSTCVRFAIPLCTPDERIDACLPSFVESLSSVSSAPDMEKVSSSGGIVGQMHAQYRPLYSD